MPYNVQKPQHLQDMFGEANQRSCSHWLHFSFSYVYDGAIVGPPI